MAKEIGIIAGNGQFPLLLARAARENGYKVIAVAHEGETDPVLEDVVNSLVWVKIGQLQRSIEFFKSHGVTEVVMAGGLIKSNAMANIDPDERTLSLMTRIANFHDDGFLRALSEEYEKDGIVIKPSTIYTPELLAPEGVLTRKRPTEMELKDVQLGWKVAKAMGQLDVGQCAIVKNLVVVALEAVEGTDETIRRGGQLGGPKTVVVKTCKPTQDLRFDLPTVGLGTIQVMSEVKSSVLVLEAGKTIIFDRAQMIAAAERAGITIVARKDN